MEHKMAEIRAPDGVAFNTGFLTDRPQKFLKFRSDDASRRPVADRPTVRGAYNCTAAVHARLRGSRPVSALSGRVVFLSR